MNSSLLDAHSPSRLPRLRDRPLRALRPMMGLRFPAVALAIAGSLVTSTPLLANAPSPAERYPTREIGDWMVAASADRQGCFLTRTYPPPRETTLLFGLDLDGANRLTLLNARWSVREKERLGLTFRMSGAAFPDHGAIGIAAGERKGFAATFGPDFPRQFASSRFLHVTRGTVPVEELTLDGSGAAVAELRKCVESQRDTPGTANPATDRNSRIPADPFADEAKRDSED